MTWSEVDQNRSVTNNNNSGDETAVVYPSYVPSPRHSHAAVVVGSRLYLGFGYDGDYKNDFYFYDFEKRTWHGIRPRGRVPEERYRTTLVNVGGEIVLFGGHNGVHHLNDVYVFSPETMVWRELSTVGPHPSPRDSHTAIACGQNMFILGGSSGCAKSDLCCLEFSPGSTHGQWRNFACGDVRPCPRFCHAGTAIFEGYGASLFIFGGYDGRKRLNDLWELKVDCIPCEVPPSTLASELGEFVGNAELSDVQFLVEGKVVHAHKFILCARSSYFRAMFLGGAYKEGSSDNAEIELFDVRHDIFLILLRYLYTDKVSISVDVAMDLFETADQFGVDRLKRICEDKMLVALNASNAATIFLAADAHHAIQLRTRCMHFILNHFNEVSKSASFADMGRKNVELVFEILNAR